MSNVENRRTINPQSIIVIVVKSLVLAYIMTTSLNCLYLWVGWWCLSLSTAAASSSSSYTCFDDRSWSIRSTTLSDDWGKQSLYDDFMVKCRVAAEATDDPNACDESEAHRRKMNKYQPSGMRNYTKAGFLKTRAPAQVFQLLSEFWESNRHLASTEWTHVTPYHNMWDAPPKMIRLDDTSLPGGGSALQAAVGNAARESIQQWTGQRLASSSVYGIRIYSNTSILSPHVDRLPLVSSAIINVAQDVDDPWPLEVYGHDGKATNVTMEPGDMVLYESHSIIHGRPFPMNGNYYANVFVHFEPLGPIEEEEEVEETSTRRDIPPYVLPNASWVKVYRRENPNGWPLANRPNDLVFRNDLETLKYLAKRDPGILERSDGSQWGPIHEAVRQNYMDIVQFLLDNGVSVNAAANVGVGGLTPLGVALQVHGPGHAMTEYLESLGALSNAPPPPPPPKTRQKIPDKRTPDEESRRRRLASEKPPHRDGGGEAPKRKKVTKDQMRKQDDKRRRDPGKPAETDEEEEL